MVLRCNFAIGLQNCTEFDSGASDKVLGLLELGRCLHCMRHDNSAFASLLNRECGVVRPSHGVERMI